MVNLKETQACAVIALKGLSWLNSMNSLHAQVREELPDHQKHFLLPKDRAYYSSLLTGESGSLFAAFAGNRMVGSVALTRCHGYAEALVKRRVTYPDETGVIAKASANKRIGVIQSLCVLGAYTGQKISSHLLRAAVVQARHEGLTQLFAQVAQDNGSSLWQFRANGFVVIRAWEADYARCLLCRPCRKSRAPAEVRPGSAWGKQAARFSPAIGQGSGRP